MSGNARRLLAALMFAAMTAAGAAPPRPWPPGRPVEPAPEVHYADNIVSIAWVLGQIGGSEVRLLDARGLDAYRAGHLPGALWAPPDSLLQGVRPAGLQAPLVPRGAVREAPRLVCYGDSSWSSEAARLVWTLDLLGAPRATLLEGGVTGWIAAGGALESGGGPGEASADPSTGALRGPVEAEPDSSRLATRGFVRDHFGEPGLEILDARGEAAWAASIADAARGGRRAGHVPHSLPFDFHGFVRADGSFAPAQEMRAVIGRLGPRPSSPVDLASAFIVYGDDARGDACMGYVLLRRAGIEDVRLYPGGWADWADEPALPVVRIVGAGDVRARIDAFVDAGERGEHPAPLLLLDVRDPSDHRASYIPESACLPAYAFVDSFEAALARRWPGIDRGRTPVTFYCYGTGCIRSRNCCTQAARLGFRHLEWFRGGMEEWRAAGGEIARSRP